MAQQTLRNSQFPAGQSVAVYAQTHPGQEPPSGVPPGAVVTSATVAADGSVTFTGLRDDTYYWAYAQVSGDDRSVAFRTPVASVAGTNVKTVEATFTETAVAAGTYTGTVDLPAGASLLDVVVNGVALWDSAGAVTMIVGDAADPDGYFTAVNLKATDLLAGESISFDQAGGKAGAYIATAQVSPRYAAAARAIIGVVTTAATGGTAGRTRMLVVYAAPASADVLAAVKA